jgi:hypothetical protein
VICSEPVTIDLELSGATSPIRNNADTVWMKERQIEAMYRARFDERRHAAEALDHLYGELIAGLDTANAPSWSPSVAHV